MRLTRSVPFVLAVSFLFLPTAATATILGFSAILDCAQEVPSTCDVTSATGTASITFDTDTNLLSWNLVWSGLSGAATGIHFHGPADVGVNAGIVVNIGGTSGLSSPSVGSATISDTIESSLLDGLLYINIHSAAPGGRDPRTGGSRALDARSRAAGSDGDDRPEAARREYALALAEEQPQAPSARSAPRRSP